jgi:hypothetical protein
MITRKDLGVYIHPRFGESKLYQNVIGDFVLDNCMVFKPNSTLEYVLEKIKYLGFTEAL